MREFIVVGAFAGWALAAPIQPDTVIHAGTGYAGSHFGGATAQVGSGPYAAAYATALAAQSINSESWLSPDELRQGARPGSAPQDNSQLQPQAAIPSVYFDGDEAQQITWQDFSQPAPRPAQPPPANSYVDPYQGILPPPPPPLDDTPLQSLGPVGDGFRPGGFDLNLPYAQQEAQQPAQEMQPVPRPAPPPPARPAPARPSFAATPKPVASPVTVAPPVPVAASSNPQPTTFAAVASTPRSSSASLNPTTTVAPIYAPSSSSVGVWNAVTPWLNGVYTGLSWLGSAAMAEATAQEELDKPEFTPPAWSKSEWVPGATAGPMAMPTAAAPFRSSVWNPKLKDPSQGPTFQIILTGTPDLAPDARTVVPDVDIYDIDMFTTTKEVITQLKSMGKLVICYFSAGTYEPDRPDSSQYASADLGMALAQWPNEKWVNLTSPKIREIVGKRIEYAHSKGCDAIDPDNIDGYQSPLGGGLGITARETVDFVKFLSDEALKHKLAVGLKNALDIIPRVAEYVHFAVNEECVQMNECNKYNEFLRDYGKPVFHIEYPPPRGSLWSALSNNSPVAADLVTLNATDRYKWCDEGSLAGRDVNFQTVIKPKNLDGYVMYCNGSQYTTPTLKINGKNEAESGRDGGADGREDRDGLAALQALGSLFSGSGSSSSSGLGSLFGGSSSSSTPSSSSSSGGGSGSGSGISPSPASSLSSSSYSLLGNSGSSGFASGLSSLFGGGSSSTSSTSSSGAGSFLGTLFGGGSGGGGGLSSLFSGSSGTRGSGTGSGAGGGSNSNSNSGTRSGSSSFLGTLFGGGSGSSGGGSTSGAGALISGLGNLLGLRGNAGPEEDFIPER